MRAAGAAGRLLAPALALLLAACSGGAAAPSAVDDAGTAPRPDAAAAASPAPSAGALTPSEGFAVDAITFVDGDRRVPLAVWIADTPPLRATGLMGREQLPAGAGMLFVFPEESDGAFWMKDTLLPLSIAYVGADGVVDQLVDMEPCTADPCPTYPADAPYRWAVEVDRGWFGEQGITPGWRLETPAG